MEKWKATLIGVILRSRLSYGDLREFVRRSWEITPPRLFIKKNDVIVFKFVNLEDKKWVLENDPWFVGGSKPIMFKEWEFGMSIDWSTFNLVPTGVTVEDIDLVFLESKHMLGDH